MCFNHPGSDYMKADRSCLECYKRIIKSDIFKVLSCTICLIFISLIIISCLSWLEPRIWSVFGNHNHYYDIVLFDERHSFTLEDLHNAFLIVLTALIAIIAWVQLKGLYENSKADMLLRIDRNLRNAEAIKAMTIIRQFRFEIEKEIAAQNEIKVDFSKVRKEYKKEIETKTGQKIKRFLLDYSFSQHEQIVLINFLNTIENICYLCNKNYTSSHDVEEFFEYELPYYFDIFEPYIQYTQEQYDSNDNNKAYSQFRSVVKKIRCRN